MRLVHQQALRHQLEHRLAGAVNRETGKLLVEIVRRLAQIGNDRAHALAFSNAA